jgi:hypothetical protein
MKMVNENVLGREKVAVFQNAVNCDEGHKKGGCAYV